MVDFFTRVPQALKKGPNKEKKGEMSVNCRYSRKYGCKKSHKISTGIMRRIKASHRQLNSTPQREGWRVGGEVKRLQVEQQQ